MFKVFEHKNLTMTNLGVFPKYSVAFWVYLDTVLTFAVRIVSELDSTICNYAHVNTQIFKRQNLLKTYVADTGPLSRNSVSFPLPANSCVEFFFPYFVICSQVTEKANKQTTTTKNNPIVTLNIFFTLFLRRRKCS